MTKKTGKLSPEYTEIRATFKLVFISVLVIVVICLGLSVYLSLQSNLNDSSKSVLESTLTVFKVGTGAVFGLLGGKVIP